MSPNTVFKRECEILGRDDAAFTRYFVTIGGPLSKHLLTQERQDRRFNSANVAWLLTEELSNTSIRSLTATFNSRARMSSYAICTSMPPRSCPSAGFDRMWN